MKPGAWWPVAMVAVLGVTVAANAWLLVAANDPNAVVVEPDYYRRALRWDSTSAEAAASARLGWRADAAIGALDDAGRAGVRVRLSGADGQPVTGARVELTAIHNREAALHRTATLAGAGGDYAAEIELAHAGLWELRIDARRGAEHFVTRLRRDTGAGFVR